ncbi:MAG: response regulator transcription factor [Candidatus Sericytochromatia bacterium]|nr:response regulator transcription factor [Candidatus Sericytochromatia bacterium]
MCTRQDGTMAHETLLLIVDDADLATLLRDYLQRHGFKLSWADRPSAGMRLLAEDDPRLVLLDVMLPEKDGFAVCRDLRASGATVPIIMLTARGDDDDRIQGLQLGADDYLPKPFNPKELLARIHAVLRRTTPTQAPAQVVRLDGDTRTVILQDRTVSLTPTEYKLLERLLDPPGTVSTRAQLLDTLDEAGASDSFDRAIDLHISRLRHKLEPDPRHPRHLLTVWGVGYRFQC